jgi:hypothetical protein
MNLQCPDDNRMFQGQMQNEAKRQCRIICTDQPGAIANPFNKLAGLYALSCLSPEVLPIPWPFGPDCVNKHSAHSCSYWFWLAPFRIGDAGTAAPADCPDMQNEAWLQ